MDDPMQELRDDRAALVQLLRVVLQVTNVLLEAHEEIEQDHAIGLFTKEDLDGFRRVVKETEDFLRG